MDGEGRNIAIVEDDDGLRFLIQKRLQQSGFQTICISNEKELFERIEQICNASLLLLDYKLPDTTANAIIEKFQQQNIITPFIIITGHGDEKKAVEMMKLGALDYLVKDEHFFNMLAPVVLQAFKQIEHKQHLLNSLQQSKERDFYKLLEILQKQNFKMANALIQYHQGKLDEEEIQTIPKDKVITVFNAIFCTEESAQKVDLADVIDNCIILARVLFSVNNLTFANTVKKDILMLTATNALYHALLQIIDFCVNCGTVLKITFKASVEENQNQIQVLINGKILPNKFGVTLNDLCCYADKQNEANCCKMVLCKMIVNQGLNGIFMMEQNENSTIFNLRF